LVDEERFDYMLEVLPPEVMTGLGFLVGEPNDHVWCKVTGRLAPNYQPFAKVGEKFYEAVECMTVPEFRKVTAGEILASQEPMQSQHGSQPPL
jgi:hypothetical protein